MPLPHHDQRTRFRKEPRPATKDDLRQAEIISEVGKGIVAALRPILTENPYKLLNTLRRDELDAVTVAAISAYIEVRQRLEIDEELNDTLTDTAPFA